jgi:hypothetical protein
VAATADNARVNGVAVRAERFDLLRDGPAPSAPTVAANLLRPLLLAVARSGFAGAGTTHPRLVGLDQDPALIPRVEIRSSDSLLRFLGKLRHGGH